MVTKALGVSEPVSKEKREEERQKIKAAKGTVVNLCLLTLLKVIVQTKTFLTTDLVLAC